MGDRCQRCVEGIPHDFVHGARSYRYHRCRCVTCQSAHRAKNRDSYWRNHSARLAQKARQQERNSGAHRDYNTPERHAAKLRAQARWDAVPVTRRGRWSRAEDAVVLREDMTVLEKAYVLQRSYHSVARRGSYLTESPERRARRLACMSDWRHANKVLRGNAQARKTMCPKGHLYDEANTQRPPSGGRKCRTCHKLRSRKGTANALKTACPKGHPYDEANTQRPPSGGRKCKTCNRLSKRRVVA